MKTIPRKPRTHSTATMAMTTGRGELRRRAVARAIRVDFDASEMRDVEPLREAEFRAGDSSGGRHVAQYDRWSRIKAFRDVKSSSRMASPQTAQWTMLLPKPTPLLGKLLLQ